MLFDSLGPPWPLHDCLTTPSQSTPPPTTTELYNALQGVQFSVRDNRTSVLLPGMRSFVGRIEPAIVTRVGASESKTRDTMRVDPMGGEETHIGTVTHIGIISLEKRFGMASDSLGARMIYDVLNSSEITQVTILVDELAVDPDADDLMSYTFWCSVDNLPESLGANDLISATMSPVDFMGVGMTWIASAVEWLL
ncbi:MAG: hypothetical protein OXI16_02895 [Chloroflexota bacterium]|nr:hypothetical protein [Chloroflexota bacterium]